MSKKQASADAAATGAAAETAAAAIEVRALIDNPAHGLKAGELATIPAELLAPLKAAGAIDDHPDAVAYAKGL